MKSYKHTNYVYLSDKDKPIEIFNDILNGKLGPLEIEYNVSECLQDTGQTFKLTVEMIEVKKNDTKKDQR